MMMMVMMIIIIISKIIISAGAAAKRQVKPWSAAELQILMRALQGYKRPPRNDEVRDLQVVCPSLRLRNLPQIKTRAWALLQKSVKS